MNKERRKTIERALELISDAKSLLESARDEETDYYDNMPESFQNGDKGQKASDAVEALEAAISGLDEAQDGGNTAMES